MVMKAIVTDDSQELFRFEIGSNPGAFDQGHGQITTEWRSDSVATRCSGGITIYDQTPLPASFFTNWDSDFYLIVRHFSSGIMQFTWYDASQNQYFDITSTNPFTGSYNQANNLLFHIYVNNDILKFYQGVLIDMESTTITTADWETEFGS